MKTQLTRAEFLQWTAGAFVFEGTYRHLHRSEGTPAKLSAKAQGFHDAPPEAERADRVARIIDAYDAQGFHRTATEVDRQSARWLAGAATQAGAEVRLDAFSLGRIDIRSAFIEAGGRRVEGVPFFDGSFTDAGGVTGRLNTEIALVTIDTAGISSEGASLAALRRSGSHRAIVAVTNGAHPGLSLSNAGSFSAPYGAPVLQLGSNEAQWLNEQAAAGHEVRVVVDAARTPAEAINVVATVEGRDGALAPVVIMTPRSGWWHCAAERGGGLACWLDAVRAVAAAKPARSLVAIASSGHELGHLGLDAYLAGHPGLVKRATWIHLGANIGAAQGAARLQASDDAIEKLADGALSRAATVVRQRVPRGTRPSGEARNIHDAGGRYVSLLGSGPFFHNVADRWPVAVDVAAAGRFAEAFADLAVTLAQSA
jgi:hypothetical protein